MPYMTITITDIFTVPNEFITVKSMNLIIEIYIFAPEHINSFIELFFR